MLKFNSTTNKNNRITYTYTPKDKKYYQAFIQEGKENKDPNVERMTIFDLDGTLSNDKWRQRFIDSSLPDNDPRKWHEYHVNCINDDLMNKHLVKDDMWSLNAAVFTGRPITYKALTTKWLWLNGIPSTNLYMRAEGDLSPNWQVKEKFLQQLCDWCKAHPFFIYPYMAYDDDPDVIRMYRDYGLKCSLIKRT